jgi:hypothetical protein
LLTRAADGRVNGVERGEVVRTNRAQAAAQGKAMVLSLSRARAITIAVALLTASACSSSTSPSNPALTIQKIIGDAQTAPAGTTLPTALQVQVTNANGTPVSNVYVHFVPASGDGTAGADSTGPNGYVATNWTLGASPGTQTLDVQAIDPVTDTLKTYVTFTATATATVAH